MAEIIFTVTSAGRNAALNAENTGLKLELTKMVFGRGNGVQDENVTTLIDPQVETGLSAGGIQPTTNTLMLGVNVTPSVDLYVTEVGIYTDGGVLFAIARLEDQHFFILSHGIPFIASFGLKLGNLENVQVTVMQDAPIAQQMIFAHESHPDPHPQYSKAIGDLSVNVKNLLQQFFDQINNSNNDFKTEIEGDITEIKGDITDIENQIKNSIEEMNKITYPRTIACGVAVGSNSFTIDLSGKVEDLRDNKYVIHITPEGNHEAWAFQRLAQSIKVEMWHRSGTNRIGYTGNVNWSVIQASGNSVIGGDGDYIIAGTYSIPILPNETKKFMMVGAGGGGGLSVNWDSKDDPEKDGKGGQATEILIDGSSLAVAGGGLGGGGAYWDNGSAWKAGEIGEGGTTTVSNHVSSVSSTKGNDGHSARWDTVGGLSVSPIGDYGRGGDGGRGYGNGDDGWAGGAGSGAYLICNYKNTTEKTQYITLIVGNGGDYGRNANPAYTVHGTKGTDGFARVSTVG